MEAHCIARIAFVAKEHIWQIACCFPRRRSFCLLPKQTNNPHRSAIQGRRSCSGARRIHTIQTMESKGLYSSTSSVLCQDEDAFSKIREARPLGRPEGRTLTVHWLKVMVQISKSQSPPPQRVVLTPCLCGHGSATVGGWGESGAARGGAPTSSESSSLHASAGMAARPGGSATGRKGGRGARGWCGDGVGVAMALRARWRRSGTRSARRWSPVSRRGALAFCDRSGDRARRSMARRGERVPSSRRGALAFCKQKRRPGAALHSAAQGGGAVVEKRRSGFLQTRDEGRTATLGNLDDQQTTLSKDASPAQNNQD